MVVGAFERKIQVSSDTYSSQRTGMGWTTVQDGWIVNAKRQSIAYGSQPVSKSTDRWTNLVTGNVRAY